MIATLVTICTSFIPPKKTFRIIAIKQGIRVIFVYIYGYTESVRPCMRQIVLQARHNPNCDCKLNQKAYSIHLNRLPNFHQSFLKKETA